MRIHKRFSVRRRSWGMRRSIQIFFVCSILLALFLQTMLFRQSLERQIRLDSIASNENSMEKMQTDLTSFIHKVREKMLTIYVERGLIGELRTAAAGGEDHLKDYYWSAWYLARRRFDTDDRLLAMYLYDADDQLVTAYRFNCVAFPRDIYRAEYDTNAEKVREYVREEGSDLLISGYSNPLAEKNIVRLVLKLHNYDEQRRQLGYLICDIDSEAFTSIMGKYADLEQVYLWLQPAGDQIIAATGNASEEQLRTQKQLQEAVLGAYQEEDLKEEYGDSYLVHVSQDNYNMEAFALVSKSLLTATQRSLFRILAVSLAVIAVLLSVLTVWYSRWLSRPVEEMKDTIVRIKNGEAALRVQTDGWTEELQVLGVEFNEMLDRIQAMADEEYKYKLLVERTEYKMLQTQINPHFLYNTLNTMSGIANAQNCPLVSSLCHSLSAIFRYSLNIKDEFSTVQKEMDHVRNYLYVMNVRNGFSLTCEYQIADETLQDELPRICLQPIVENAVTHGLRNVRQKDKRLVVCAKHEDGNLIIAISDNGTGMDAEEMNRKLEENELDRIQSGVSIGILNVNARLKKLFGNPYGLRIESRTGEGTRVWLTVPAVIRKGETKE